LQFHPYNMKNKIPINAQSLRLCGRFLFWCFALAERVTGLSMGLFVWSVLVSLELNHFLGPLQIKFLIHKTFTRKVRPTFSFACLVPSF
jgi:hypothetical protein